MPTILGPRWPIDVSRRPPRMAPEDRDIWERWWPNNQAGALALYFDSGLGEGKPVGPGATEAEVRMWRRNTQKRTDVIIDRGNHIDICELRNAASPNSIGRLLQYRMLYDLDPVLGTNRTMWLITNLEDEDVRALAAANDIEYRVV